MEFVFVNLDTFTPTNVSATALPDTEMLEDNVKNVLITVLVAKEPKTPVLHALMDMLWIKLLVYARKLPHVNSVNTTLNRAAAAPEFALQTPTSMKTFA